MKQKAFTLIELLVVVAIIGILAAVGVVAYNGYTKSAKINAAKSNHKTVVKFIKSELMKCELGQELILKQNPTTDTPDLCPDVLAGNADKMATQLSYHFSSLNWCNPMGWMGGSVCAEAVETSGTIGEGTTGATKLLTKSGSPSILFIDTKYTCEPLPLTELCHGKGKSLTDSVELN
jgi:prepilin-type N-terminal cleavage/methylation domain-containing protein